MAPSRPEEIGVAGVSPLRRTAAAGLLREQARPGPRWEFSWPGRWTWSMVS